MGKSGKKKYCRAGQATDDNMLRSTRFTDWIPKTTNTHSECVKLTDFPLQQWLHERASMLSYTNILPFLCTFPKLSFTVITRKIIACAILFKLKYDTG